LSIPVYQHLGQGFSLTVSLNSRPSLKIMQSLFELGGQTALNIHSTVLCELSPQSHIFNSTTCGITTNATYISSKLIVTEFSNLNFVLGKLTKFQYVLEAQSTLYPPSEFSQALFRCHSMGPDIQNHLFRNCVM
ncbi:hypothetical protein L9F63_011643, partial [Diploptera punctata]